MPGAWPGFSFALHLLRVQGFYFALLQCSPIQAFTADFASFMQLYHPRYKTVHRALQGLFLLFAVFCRCRVAGASSYTAPPVPRWSVYQRPDALHRYQTPTPRRILHRSAQPPYYNKVYKGAGVRPVMDPCQTVQHTADHASPAGSLCLPRPAACNLAPVSSQGAPGQSSGRGVAGGAEPLAATAVSLFGLSPDS